MRVIRKVFNRGAIVGILAAILVALGLSVGTGTANASGGGEVYFEGDLGSTSVGVYLYLNGARAGQWHDITNGQWIMDGPLPIPVGHYWIIDFWVNGRYVTSRSFNESTFGGGFGGWIIDYSVRRAASGAPEICVFDQCTTYA